MNSAGQRVLLNIRVFDLNARWYMNLNIQCFKKNEEEKKMTYNERVQVENDTFNPLVFSANGGMGRECKHFTRDLLN